MDVLSFIGGIFKPAADLIDNVHTSSEEKLQLRNQLAQIEQDITKKVIELEKEKLAAQSSIIVAEAQGDSVLQRVWRPLLMLWFAILLGTFWFGLTPESVDKDLMDSLFDLLKIGIGGYIGGRSAEKVAKTLKGK